MGRQLMLILAAVFWLATTAVSPAITKKTIKFTVGKETYGLDVPEGLATTRVGSGRATLVGVN